MTRINIIVEGATEESFIKNIVAPALGAQHVFVTPIILGKPGHKGGNVTYARVKDDVLRQLKQDQSAYCSTMLDLYGLGAGFPQTNLRGSEKAIELEGAVLEDIRKSDPDLRPDIRFIPYIQVHEFEGLLFSDSEAFAKAIGKSELSAQFRKIREAFQTPEDINDDPKTAPSKRILSAYPKYSKVSEGTLAAQAVGLEKMRLECPHFSSWLSRLAELSAA